LTAIIFYSSFLLNRVWIILLHFSWGKWFF
jgi:hypothetical protein